MAVSINEVKKAFENSPGTVESVRDSLLTLAHKNPGFLKTNRVSDLIRSLSNQVPGTKAEKKEIFGKAAQLAKKTIKESAFHANWKKSFGTLVSLTSTDIDGICHSVETGELKYHKTIKAKKHIVNVPEAILTISESTDEKVGEFLENLGKSIEKHIGCRSKREEIAAPAVDFSFE